MKSLVFILVLAATALLCLSMSKHYEQLFSSSSFSPQRRWILMNAGIALLALALYISTAVFGAAFGTLYWIGFFLPSGVLVTLAVGDKKKHKV